MTSISFILTISSPNNKLTSQEEGKCQCESDLRSNEHYLSSSENKALKKFRPVWDLNPWLPRYRCGALPSSTIFTSLSAVHIYDFHIVTVIYSSHHGFVWNQHNDQLPIGMLNQNKKKNILSLSRVLLQETIHRYLLNLRWGSCERYSAMLHVSFRCRLSKMVKQFPCQICSWRAIKVLVNRILRILSQDATLDSLRSIYNLHS